MTEPHQKAAAAAGRRIAAARRSAHDSLQQILDRRNMPAWVDLQRLTAAELDQVRTWGEAVRQHAVDSTATAPPRVPGCLLNVLPKTHPLQEWSSPDKVDAPFDGEPVPRGTATNLEHQLGHFKRTLRKCHVRRGDALVLLALRGACEQLMAAIDTALLRPDNEGMAIRFLPSRTDG